MVKAVVRLLQEARPFGTGKNQEESHRRTMQVQTVDDDDEAEDEDRPAGCQGGEGPADLADAAHKGGHHHRGPQAGQHHAV